MSFARDKKVLVVTSHQDDESLFCGGLLTRIIGEDSHGDVICMSAKRPKTESRRFFRNGCANASGERPAITTTFREARHVWSNVDFFLRSGPSRSRR